MEGIDDGSKMGKFKVRKEDGVMVGSDAGSTVGSEEGLVLGTNDG